MGETTKFAETIAYSIFHFQITTLIASERKLQKYESYADMGLNEWITMRIEVEGTKAKLFLNNNKQPSLIVNDLKHGENNAGSIGLWYKLDRRIFQRFESNEIRCKIRLYYFRK
jgi:hypothetical protein